MEYRDDLFQSLMAGLSRSERADVIDTINRNTDAALTRKRNSVGSRGGAGEGRRRPRDRVGAWAGELAT